MITCAGDVGNMIWQLLPVPHRWRCCLYHPQDILRLFVVVGYYVVTLSTDFSWSWVRPKISGLTIGRRPRPCYLSH